MNKLRRTDRIIDPEDAIELLNKEEYGVLSTVGQDGVAYGVPLNYVYKENALYFHSAKVGHKLDNIKGNPNVSFCVVGKTTLLPADFSTEYASCIVFGTAIEIEGVEKNSALLWLVEKYSPGFLQEGKEMIEKQGRATVVVKMTIDHVSGKGRS